MNALFKALTLGLVSGLDGLSIHLARHPGTAPGRAATVPGLFFALPGNYFTAVLPTCFVGFPLFLGLGKLAQTLAW